MPELPEVETIVRYLREHIVGAEIESVRLLRRDIVRSGTRSFPEVLQGRTIETIGREGKRIHVRLQPTGNLLVHLGMSGRLTLEPDTEPLKKHTHLRMRFNSRDTELRFRDPRRFGGIWFDEDRQSVDPLGPDALAIRVPVL